MTVKEFISKSDISKKLEFEICDDVTCNLLYMKDCKELKDLLPILDDEITQIYINPTGVRLLVDMGARK
jgi:hypothetical protein